MRGKSEVVSRFPAKLKKFAGNLTQERGTDEDKPGFDFKGNIWEIYFDTYKI